MTAASQIRPPKQSISISISPVMLAQIDALAEKLDMPRSIIIQQALREYLSDKA